MKKLCILLSLSLLSLLFILSACQPSRRRILRSLGDCVSSEQYSSEGFQDYTDYAKYHIPNAKIADNRYLKRIDDAGQALLLECLEDFERWIATYRTHDPVPPIAAYYDFDRSCIDQEDYLYIDAERFDDSESSSLASFNVYFFDTQTETLYYFHNNL